MRTRRSSGPLRRAAALAALCLVVAACGGGGKHDATRSTTLGAPPAYPASFNARYEQAWGQMRAVAEQVAALVRQVRSAASRHHSIPNGQIASQFALFASRMEPAVIEFQGMTPPASVAKAYHAMVPAALNLAAALRSFSTDANSNHPSRGARDIAAYFTYEAILDRGALEIYQKLGIS